jgi:hypothetical protein
MYSATRNVANGKFYNVFPPPVSVDRHLLNILHQNRFDCLHVLVSLAGEQNFLSPTNNNVEIQIPVFPCSTY